ncbi:hypothetical protein [Rudanella lutea]|uniref:hypothetical protein n=1 Tax=Rudanella lutea TaxID=451374 RepID=UPI00036AE9CC|nr:hypothetical protein [Rudanella lutea]
MNFLSLLQQQAGRLHEQIRGLLSANPSNDVLPLKQYQQLLCINLAYYRALERALTEQAAYLPGYDRLLQCRTPYLVADLLATGAPIPQQYPTYFASWSSWKLLGAAYVGEGLSTEAKEINVALQKSPLVPPMARISRFFNTSASHQAVESYVRVHAKGHEEEVFHGVQEALQLYSNLAHDPAVVQ